MKHNFQLKCKSFLQVNTMKTGLPHQIPHRHYIPSLNQRHQFPDHDSQHDHTTSPIIDAVKSTQNLNHEVNPGNDQ